MNLLDILIYTRKHESKGEALFINNYLVPKLNELGYKPSMDGCGNVWVETATKEEAPFLFVAHIDTCHQKDEGFLKPIVKNNIVRMNPADINHGCLGADDGVGIYCNLRMIEAGVKGTFLFTRGEEKGGVGATYISKSTPEKLEGFLMSVEVDRAGTDEIIVSQCYGDCASEAYAADLGNALGMGHSASYMGVYTDVSEFADIIPENVNIAAGYEGQHTVKETVNLTYVEALVEKLIAVDWGSLSIVRTPGDFGDSNTGWWDWQRGNTTSDFDRLNDYVQSYPEKVAFFLESLSVDVYEIEAEWEKGYEGFDNYFDDEQLAVGMV